MSQGEAGGTRHIELSRYLAKQGHSMTVIASSVSYLTGRAAPADARDEKKDGIEVIRTWSSGGAQRSFFERLLSFVSFMCSSFAAALRVRNVDLVWGTSPADIPGFTAWLGCPAEARAVRV